MAIVCIVKPVVVTSSALLFIFQRMDILDRDDELQRDGCASFYAYRRWEMEAKCCKHLFSKVEKKWLSDSRQAQRQCELHSFARLPPRKRKEWLSGDCKFSEMSLSQIMSLTVCWIKFSFSSHLFPIGDMSSKSFLLGSFVDYEIPGTASMKSWRGMHPLWFFFMSFTIVRDTLEVCGDSIPKDLRSKKSRVPKLHFHAIR